MSPAVSFRIRRTYFDQIVSGSKDMELRRFSRYWQKVFRRILDHNTEPWVAVFVCGKDVHRREILKLTLYSKAEKALGRKLSTQGRKDVGRGFVLAFHLGLVVQKKDYRCPECGGPVKDADPHSLYLYCPKHGPAIPRKGPPPGWSKMA